MNLILNPIKVILDMTFKGILTLITLLIVMICLGMFIHTFFLFAGYVDIAIDQFGFSPYQAVSIMAIPLMWLVISLYVSAPEYQSPKLSKKSINNFFIVSAISIVLLHVAIFTTPLGSLYIEFMKH